MYFVAGMHRHALYVFHFFGGGALVADPGGPGEACDPLLDFFLQKRSIRAKNEYQTSTKFVSKC